MDYLYQRETIETTTNYKIKCIAKLNNKNPEEKSFLSNFIKISDEILKKYPLIFLKDLLEDYVLGISDQTILIKYGFTRRGQFKSIFYDAHHKMVDSFDFKSMRTTIGANSKQTNFRKPKFYEQYKRCRDGCDFFEDELSELFIKNIIQGSIILMLIDSEKEIEAKDIINNISEIFQKQKQKFSILKNISLVELVEKKINDGATELIEEILIELIAIDSFESNYENNTHKIPNIKTMLTNNVNVILAKEIDGIRRDKLEITIIDEMPLLKYIPNRELFDKICEELEEKKILQLQKEHGNKSPQGDNLFLIKNFKQKKSHKDERFFGRKNDAWEFVHQIVKLEKGDFDDKDDQVTRIAGLILTQSGLKSTPRGDLEEFDFIVNLDDFEPNEEQQKVMKKSDFKITAKKMHVKVMINESITLELIKKIKNGINDDDQAVLISFKEIDGKIKQNIANSKIQIVNREALRDWAATVPYIPSRTGSVVKIQNGIYVGRIGKINNINYASGITSFSMIPDTGIEYNTQIGDLEEIELFESDVDDVEQIFKNYIEFLNLICNLSENKIFEKSIYNPKLGQIKIKYKTDLNEKEWSWTSTVEEILTEINLNGVNKNKIMCTCEYWKINEPKKFFCEHIIALLNSKALSEGWIDETWNEPNLMLNFLKSV